MLDVAFILDVLDDRYQDSGIALPEKNALDIGDGIALHEIRHFAMVVAKNDDGNIQPGLLHVARQLRRVHVTDVEVGHDQVELLGASEFGGFGAGGNVGNSGNVLGTEIEGLVDEEFVEASIFAEDEGIVEAGDEKDVVDFEGHQVFEAFEALFSVGDGDGLDDAVEGHGLLPSLRGRTRGGSKDAGVGIGRSLPYGW